MGKNEKWQKRRNRMSDRKLDYIPLKDAKPAKRNPKDHDLGAIYSSVMRFGYVDPIIMDERTGRLVAGHGRIDAIKSIKQEGKPPPSGVKARKDDWLIPVVRGWASKNDAEADAYLLASNRLVELGGWNKADLDEMLKDLASKDALDGSGYDFDDVPVDFQGEEPEALGNQNIKEAAKKYPAASGDLWLLGEHRIVCGDSTDKATVATLLGDEKPHLMVTDPPYGVEYDAKWRGAGGLLGKSTRAVGLVENDDRSDWSDAWVLFPGDVAYVWHAAVNGSAVAESLVSSGFEIRSQIIWNKNYMVIGRGDYHWKHEPCWYAVRKGKTGHYNGDRTQTTVWDIEKPQTSETGHSTQKPIECMSRPIKNNSKEGDAVYEPFSGSGTTLVACEQLKRRCFAMELNPDYVSVTIDRWERLTGGKAAKATAPRRRASK